MTAKAIAVLGTGSDVGKSLIAAGLCRILLRAGARVAPFKAQNMSLNSFVTTEGGEIGRAQALQAEASRLAPHVDMNPILLKPESDECAQVVVQGKVFAKRHASAYFDGRRTLWPIVAEAYARLAAQYDVLVIEGAGSAAEVNLRKHDLVNWPVVMLADAQVLLVADIDRGGVFAQIVGTLDLLEPEERARVRGIIINKFRGDLRLFEDGVTFLESRTGVPVLGVVPFLRDLALDQEDSLDSARQGQAPFAPDRINIGIILLPHMSNFTDFNALSLEDDVVVRYVSTPSDLAGADVVAIPGSKNTLNDLRSLRERGFTATLDAHLAHHKELLGICGGYQMLGKRITDPYQVEGGGAAMGLGYLSVETELQREKRTTQVTAHPIGLPDLPHATVSGYHIHMGLTSRQDERPCFALHRQNLPPLGDSGTNVAQEEDFDGAIRADGLVWGTYIHGVFDQPEFRRLWLNRIRARKGVRPLDALVSMRVTTRLRGELDRWADHLTQHLKVSSIIRSVSP